MMDDALFDPGQFQAELAIKSSPIAAFKKAIRQADTVLAQRFEDGRDIHQLIHERAWFTDQSDAAGTACSTASIDWRKYSRG